MCRTRGACTQHPGPLQVRRGANTSRLVPAPQAGCATGIAAIIVIVLAALVLFIVVVVKREHFVFRKDHRTQSEPQSHASTVPARRPAMLLVRALPTTSTATRQRGAGVARGERRMPAV